MLVPSPAAVALLLKYQTDKGDNARIGLQPSIHEVSCASTIWQIAVLTYLFAALYTWRYTRIHRGTL